jgi:methylmalonyl-CoA mutase
MTLQDDALSGAFAPANEEQWRRSVDRALKGGAFEKLIAKTYDGGEIRPLYARAADAGPRAWRKTPGRWAVLARVDLADPEAANAQAIEDLEGGVDGLQLVFRGSLGAYGAAFSGDDGSRIARLLERVRLDYGVPVALEDSPFARNAADAVARLVDANHIEPSITRISFGFDPLGLRLRHGEGEDWASEAAGFAERAKRAAKAGFATGAVAVDARLVHAAGGTEAQELGYALATGLAYLRTLADSGLDVETARGLLLFRLATDAEEFASVGKFRALRRLWARVEEACGLAPAPALVHAETAWRMMSRNDPWNNLLRTTIAVFSGAVGGADCVTALPFTQAIGAPDAFARRLARDTQLVLQDESYLHVVDDPAAGSGGFEAATEALCQHAWDLFQSIEAEGGLPKALAAGRFQAEVVKAAAQRAANVARAKEKITGSNEFPDVRERALSVVAPFDLKAGGNAPGAGALAPKRLSEPFEALRETADALVARGRPRPRVFLATLGSVAAFTARANFAKNFFEAAGLEAVFGPESDNSAEVTEAFRLSGAKLACLCSSDQIYSDAAKPMAIALKGAGATLYLAGRPGELEADLRQGGVQHFIFAGCDMLDILRGALESAT